MNAIEKDKDNEGILASQKEGRQNSWIAKVWIAEELLYYNHPFLFPDFLQRKPTKHEFEVQFKVIQVFSSVDLEKTFYIKEFFQNYPSTLTNQQIAKIKKYFIQLIQIFQEHKLVDSNYKIISNGKLYDKDELTSNNISEGFVVYEKNFWLVSSMGYDYIQISFLKMAKVPF
jgi:hypothetical protein